MFQKSYSTIYISDEIFENLQFKRLRLQTEGDRMIVALIKIYSTLPDNFEVVYEGVWDSIEKEIAVKNSEPINIVIRLINFLEDLGYVKREIREVAIKNEDSKTRNIEVLVFDEEIFKPFSVNGASGDANAENSSI